MARKLFIFCITIFIASTNVSTMRIQRATRLPFLSNLEDASTIKEKSINTNSLLNIQGEDLIYQDRTGLRKKSCESSTMCEEATNYPTAEVEEFIKSLGKDEIARLQRFDSLDENDYSQRTNVVDVPLCDVPREEPVFRKSGADKNGNLHFLLNTDEIRFQSFRVQTCERSGCKCNKVKLQEGYIGRCTQFYYYRAATAVRRIETIERTNRTLEVYNVQIKLPSHCACTVHDCAPDQSLVSVSTPLCDGA